MKVFVKIVVHHRCIAQYKILSEIFYFEVSLVQELVSCEVTKVTNSYTEYIVNLEFNFLYVLTPTGSTIINQNFLKACLHQELLQ